MADFRSRLAARSVIVWGEHCSECAFPTCYSQCVFYTPRADLHCRRFDRGIERLSSADGLQLVQIQFRRWGKLEGQGPSQLVPLADADQREERDAWVSARLNTPGLPRRVSGGLIGRWNALKAGPRQADDAGSHFVVETWLDPARHAAPIPFTLTILDLAKAGDTLFQSPFEIRPGYGRWLVPTDDIKRMIPLDAPFLVQIEPVGDAPPVPIVFGLTDFVRAQAGQSLNAGSAGAPAKRKTAKCVVWDLDDTLWEGVLAEDGIEGLRVRPEAVELIKQLDARGILMSVASKNDPEPALAALEQFGLRDYFLFPQIGWGPKSVSVRQIAELLDIGSDTFVFIDDQPFERAEVQSGVNGITVIDSALMDGLQDHPLFDVPATAESARRRAMYQTEETRQAVFQASGSDYLQFLSDCRIELRVSHLGDASLERVFELTQRTNQLNFSGARYDRTELRAMMSEAGRTHVLSCSDKFGDYGIIGFVVADPNRAEIESFFMSCRVQRKRVENALFEYLRSAWGAPAEMRARYRATEKNAASARMLQSLGFVATGEGFVRRGDLPFAEAGIVTLRLSAVSGAGP
jgi:FkbH-like protein